MQSPQEARRRARSPFVAAVLSLFFPGLGHAYAGAYHRALGFAAPPILLFALLAGFVLRANQAELFGLLLAPWVLPSVFVFNLIAAGSVEERMLGLQAHKRRLADAILAQGGGSGPGLSERDVDDLLAPLE